MQKKSLAVFLSLAFLFIALAGAQASGHGKEKPPKKGILLVVFGSTHPEAQAAFNAIAQKTAALFPGVPVRFAYTSHIIREKLAKEGKALESPAQALANMANDGFTHVAVQSFHTIPGKEFHDLLSVVRGFHGMPDAPQKITVGAPLLNTQEDMDKAAKALLATLPKTRKPGEAVVLMGHGTPHPANAMYPALMWQTQQTDSGVFIGTVEGYPGPDEILAALKKQDVKKIWLMPFMSVAGDHAKNDMAGDEEDSWKSRFTKAGLSCEPVLKGTAEYPEFLDIWMAHLASAVKELE
jgi:sirohydrochlorin cobaltochelatase